MLCDKEDREELFKSIGDYPEKVQEIIWDQMTEMLNYYLGPLDECKSPIEQILAIPLQAMCDRLERLNCIDAIVMNCQHPINIDGKTLYHVDFLIAIMLINGTVMSFVIECDGHEFHEKTKKQVAKDKARERNIQAAGHSVIRFSGSEIYKNPFSCAEEVREIIKSKFTDISR